MAYQLNLNWPEFLEKYWQKQPVVLKNAFPNFVDPITPDELAGLAMEPEVDSRLVSHFNGKWQASNGPFEHFDDLGETGWSLLAQAVNHWHMPAAELVRPFRVLPDWRLGLARRDKIAGARLRRDQLEVLEDLIGLLYGADAHAVLLAQRAHRRQTFAAAIQPLLNAFSQKIGQMLVARHAVSSVFTIQIIKPVQIAAKIAMQILF